MKKVNYEQFLGFEPCWMEDEDKAEQLRQYAEQQAEWSALDILGLEEVTIEERLWAVLRPELIDEPVIHEFAYRCAEYSLTFVEKPDPRSLAAIAAKRKWLKREITDDELRDAWAAARAAARDAASAVAWAAASAAAWDAASAAAWAAARVAASAAARVAASAAWKHELNILMELLSECGQEGQG